MIYPKNSYHLDQAGYQELYHQSVADPATFWEQQEKAFLSQEINITYNCLDRHLENGGDKIAYISVSEHEPVRQVTYRELSERVNQLGNYLLSLGVKKGDTVTIYMPLIVEAVIAMLACARIGAIHSVVYAGFSSQALATRIAAAGSRVVLTADYTYRRGKAIDLLSVVRKASSSIRTIVLVRDTTTVLSSHEFNWQETRKYSTQLTATEVSPTDSLFILYTSGTTGAPKGIVHGTRGYNLYTHVTTHYTFDLQENDVYWCTADLGWISGHSYVVYGPLSNHATILIQEGVPDYPDAGAWWKIIDEYKVNILYTSPTAIRLLMAYGNEWPGRYHLDSLRLLGSVGEPLNPAAWEWFVHYVGHDQCALVDTWWQTEKGGHLLVTLPGLGQKPGLVGLPFFGIIPLIIDAQNQACKAGEKGNLVIIHSWPSALIDCWQDPARYQAYWHTFPPYFATGDIAVQDEDGYIRILGRSDDIIIVAGHNISSAELESVLTSHPQVTEAAVVGIPDSIKGNQIVAFVTQAKEVEESSVLVNRLIEYIGDQYGKHARPSRIVFLAKLPKTRSGKIMRRLLRSQLLGNDPGDTSTLEN